MEGELWVSMSEFSTIYDAAYERIDLPVDIASAEIYEISERMRYLYQGAAFSVEICTAIGAEIGATFDNYEDAEGWAETFLDDYYE